MFVIFQGGGSGPPVPPLDPLMHIACADPEFCQGRGEVGVGGPDSVFSYVF